MIRRSSRGNDNHWPKGTPGGKGGQFAPKGKGVAISNSENYYETKTLFRSGYISQAEFEQMTQKPKFTPAKTIKEAEDYCRSLGVKPYYKGLSLDTCNAINESITYTLNEFPKTRELLRVCGSGQEINKAKKKEVKNHIILNTQLRGYTISEKWVNRQTSRLCGRMNSGTMAYTYSVESTGQYAEITNKYLGIYVNSKYDGFNGSMKHAEKTGYHPKGCTTTKSVIDHECGHLIHATYGGVKVYMHDSSIKDELSEYAMTNIKEYHAEAWSEFVNSPRPRKRAKEVGEEFLRRAHDKE